MEDFRVKRMFESIAFSYDFQNSFLSLGMDVFWRRALARSVTAKRTGLVLDLATGTAEVAMEICKRDPRARVIGVDFSPGMLSIGQRKIRSKGLEDRVQLLMGDARRLPVRSCCADCVTMAFGIRNIKERGTVLRELRRVLKRGGQLLIMEFDYPDDPVLGNLYRIYFHHILPPVGNLISRTSGAYSYLANSVQEFPKATEFLSEMGAAGFGRLNIRKLSLGIAKIYSGIKGHPQGNMEGS